MAPHDAAPVLFVVPTFNRARDLPRTLGAIAAQRDAGPVSILVVDNASTDDTPAVLARLAGTLGVPLEHLRKAPEGPTVARNIGLARGAGGLVALVDSDVELAPGWLAAARAALDADPRLAQAAGPLVFAHAPGTLNAYGGAVGRLGLAWDEAEGAPAGVAEAPRDVAWINTAAVLLRADAALDAGGFDPAFFYGYEEPDLGLRLALRGWRSRVVPGALALHHVGAGAGPSDPAIVFHYTKNRLRMGLKCFPAARLAWWLPLSLGYGILDAVLHPPRGARARALLDTLGALPVLLAARRRARPPGADDAALARCIDARWFPPTRLRAMRRRHAAPGEAAADDRVAAR